MCYLLTLTTTSSCNTIYNKSLFLLSPPVVATQSQYPVHGGMSIDTAGNAAQLECWRANVFVTVGPHIRNRLLFVECSNRNKSSNSNVCNRGWWPSGGALNNDNYGDIVVSMRCTAIDTARELWMVKIGLFWTLAELGNHLPGTAKAVAKELNTINPFSSLSVP